MTRILFQSCNRRGLGHLMRGLNIARAIQTLDPAVQCVFYTRNTAAQSLCAGFESIVAPDDADEAHWHAVAAQFAPDLAVYDTMLPASTRGGHAIFVMRACKPEEQAAVLNSPVLRTMRSIIVPHTRADFGIDLPADLEARAHFVGPIVRPLQQSIQEQLRERYGIGHADRLVVSTVGGGGFAEQARAFFEVIARVHPLLVARIPRLRHIVVRGPLFADAFVSQPGMTVVNVEPELGNLFALADLVIAEGGYNTVNEVQLAKAPAVFLPSDRKLDDQHLRVLSMTQRGLADAYATGAPNAAAGAIAQLFDSPERLAAMRAAYADDRMVTGNRAAAELILASARTSHSDMLAKGART
jgi:predicted glycosyltransferase